MGVILSVVSFFGGTPRFQFYRVAAGVALSLAEQGITRQQDNGSLCPEMEKIAYTP